MAWQSVRGTDASPSKVGLVSLFGSRVAWGRLGYAGHDREKVAFMMQAKKRKDYFAGAVSLCSDLRACCDWAGMRSAQEVAWPT